MLTNNVQQVDKKITLWSCGVFIKELVSQHEGESSFHYTYSHA
jgi:hypothetical protein